MSQRPGEAAAAEIAEARWRSVYRVGAVTILAVVLVGILEMAITFLPGGNTVQETVLDWFALFRSSWFMGLRDLGLLNIVITVLGIPVYLALYAAHRRVDPVYAALAAVIALVGVATFLATNRAFPMLELSGRYAAAATEAEKSMLAAAGQALLAVGQSHTPGTFLGFFLSEVAGITISAVMLRGRVFGPVTAYVGMLGFGLLLLFEICSSFVPALSGAAMFIAMGGGVLSMAWYVLVARRLFQLGAGSGGKA